MSKNLEFGDDINNDTGSDAGGNNIENNGSELADNAGVDLNAAVLTETDVANGGMNKTLMSYDVPPPIVLPPVTEITTKAPESPQERINNVKDYFEDLGGGFQDLQEIKNRNAEIKEVNNTLNESIPADHCDPPPAVPLQQQIDAMVRQFDLNSGEIPTIIVPETNEDEDNR